MSTPSPLVRRSFLSRLGAGVAALGAAAGLTAPAAGQQPGAFQPARHPQDDWLDQVPGKHRFFFDATSPTGAGDAITFASNFYVASKTGYGLEPHENAVVICLRHWATPFAFGDTIWARYGAILADRIKFTDPKTQAAPVINVYRAAGYPMLSSRGTTLDAMVTRGTHFAVCDLATRAFAGMIAARTGGTADAVYGEMQQAVIPNAHFMAAGIVAVNRAQERGYALQYIG